MKEAGDLFDICQNFHKGNPESVASRRVTNSDLDRSRVMEAIALSGLHGMTCDEAEVALGMSHQSCSARLSELKMRGLVRVVGTRPTRTGCSASVLTASKENSLPESSDPVK